MAVLSKREKLLESALELFSQQGIQSTSTASIAKHAQVANGTLFHHFPNKQQLIKALYVSIKHELSLATIIDDEMSQMSVKMLTKALWEIAIDWATSNPNQLIFCLQVSAENALSLEERLEAMRHELSVLETVILAGQADNSIASFPLDLMLDHCQSQIMSTGLFFINNPTLVSDDSYRSSAFELFWRAIEQQ